MSEDAPRTEPTRTVTTRVAYFDNAKAILIVLVVLGHVMQLALTSTEPGSSLYLLVYTFHMPAFAAVTGYFARPDIGTGKGRARFLGILAALVLFQTLHVLLQLRIDGQIDVPRALEYPAYTLWWLLSLLYWLLLLPLFSGTKSTRQAIGALAVAVALAVLSGYAIDDGASYSLSRTFVFLPFFLGGYYARQHEWRLPRAGSLRLAALAIFVAVGLASSTLEYGVWRDWLQARLTFEHLSVGSWGAPWILRLTLLGASALMTLSFLLLVPRRRLPLTALGPATLSVYLWHALAVSAIDQLEMDELFAGTWVKALALVAAIVVIAGFGPVAKLTVRLLNGRISATSTAALQGEVMVQPEQGERRAG